MKSSLRVTFCIATALCVLALVSAALAAESKRPVRINGAASASEQVQDWAQAYTASNPDVSFVVTGSSAGKGFESLIAGNAELCLSTRNISSKEEEAASSKGMKFDSRLIGYAGLAIVTSKRNPVNELSMGQIEKIFTGEYTKWSEVGGPDEPIRCLARRVPQSGAAVFFMRAVLHNKPYAKATQFTETWGAILKVCTASQELPIAIAPRLQAEKSAVKIIRVKQSEQAAGVLPTPETMKNKTYPIVVPILLYWNTSPQDDRVLKFVEFCEQKGIGKPSSEKSSQ